MASLLLSIPPEEEELIWQLMPWLDPPKRASSRPSLTISWPKIVGHRLSNKSARGPPASGLISATSRIWQSSSSQKETLPIEEGRKEEEDDAARAAGRAASRRCTDRSSPLCSTHEAPPKGRSPEVRRHSMEVTSK
eukprot:scaffold5218_cov150-Ochromonas_danica.AAC.12